MSELLDKAQNFENETAAKIAASKELQAQRPQFHLASPSGWINDPNGFSFYNGKIHLFFQYYPYENIWGPMHWGHVTSTDFINWHPEKIVFAPDESYDCGGCFSGTAIEDAGKHVIVYTGVTGINSPQVQCVAVGDGETYTKLDTNPIITEKDVPFEFVHEHFRDPKIWKDGDTYYLLAGMRSKAKGGIFVLFTSHDYKSGWKFASVVDESDFKIGAMWECPDMFPLDGKTVAIFSPQEIKAGCPKGFNEGNNSAYMIGCFDKITCKFTRDILPASDATAAMLDYGIDFYAPQTMLMPDGRRVLIGWMQNWEVKITPPEYPWTGMMTIPRELHIKDGWLYQTPVREFDLLRGEVVTKVVAASEVSAYDAIFACRHGEIDFEISEDAATDGKGKLELRLAQSRDKKTFVSLFFDTKMKTLTFDRSHISIPGKTFCRTMELPTSKNGKITFRCILDTCSLEVFINDGQAVFSNIFFVPAEHDEISVHNNLSEDVKFTFYKMK